MANDRRDNRGATGAYPPSRPAGKRFKSAPSASPRASRPSTAPRPARGPQRPQTARPVSQGVGRASSARQSRSAYSRAAASRRGPSPIAVVLTVLAVVAAVAGVLFFVVPAVSNLLMPPSSSVEAGKEVQVTIPEGASGDVIASRLAEAHVIEDPKKYYAAVERLDAAMSLKPGDYILYTGMDPEDVVRQLVEGPNVEGVKLVIQEGLTVQQTAANVEATYGIPADELLAQAKASFYVGDYPFLEGAYDDSLEGYLYPKTYSLGDSPSVDEIIRALLDQFVVETSDVDLNGTYNGLSFQQILCMASLIERETAIPDERPLVASVIYNRLEADMPLQIDAAIVYARGGGSQGVTYSDLEIDSPYNVYKNRGLTPGPICSPSISSIRAAIDPADTDYLYYVASAAMDGTHKFSSDYDQFLKDREEYSGSAS